MSGIPEILSDKNRNRMAKNIGGKWKDLAYELGFRDADIDRFKANNIENLQGQIRDMLGEWVRANAGDGISEKLVNALERAELVDMVNELEASTRGHEQREDSPQEGASAQASSSQHAAPVQPVINNPQGCAIHIGPANNNKTNFQDRS